MLAETDPNWKKEKYDGPGRAGPHSVLPTCATTLPPEEYPDPGHVCEYEMLLPLTVTELNVPFQLAGDTPSR